MARRFFEEAVQGAVELECFKSLNGRI